MFKINEDKSIYITRGDIATIDVTASVSGEGYEFQEGDVVRFKVFEKKECENVVFQKDVLVAETRMKVSINLIGTDTKIGELINKPKDYWYEIELNPETAPQTIIGYDEEGAKVFRLYPEGSELNE